MSLAPLRILLVLAGLASAGVAFATAVVHMDTRALVQRSSDIVVGEVTATHAHWDASHTRILTDVTVRVDERMKGAAATEVTLTQIGGELDGFRYHVDGAPGFARGEQALLFVWRDAAGRAQVNGLSQGKFEIERETGTGARLVKRSLPGLGFSDLKSLRAVPAGAAPARVTLDDMKAEIRRVLEGEVTR